MPRKTVYKPIEKIKKIFIGGGLEPPKFMPSYLEWLFKKGESIHLVTLTFIAADVIYTVPKDKILYMTSYYLYGRVSADRLVTFSLWTTNLPQTHYAAQLIRFDLWKDQQRERIVMNPSLPLKIQSGAKIIIGVSHSDGTCWCGFAGFLIKRKDIPAF